MSSSTTSPKPTIIFVPGAWHTPTHYDHLLTPLRTGGFPLHGVRTPSVGAKPPHADFSADVAAVRSAISSAVDAGEDVVVLCHSYGGIPGSEACRGFVKGEVDGKGKAGVVRIVYLAAFALDEGGTLLQAIGGSLADWIVDEGDGTLTPHNTAHIFYNDLSAPTAASASKTLLTHSFGTFTSPLTFPAWKHVPATYIICELDNAIPAAAQEFMSSQEGGKGEWDVRRLKSSHSPHLSLPEEAARVVGEACLL